MKRKVIGLAVVIVVLIIVNFLYIGLRDSATSLAYTQALRQITLACEAYADNNGGEWPAELSSSLTPLVIRTNGNLYEVDAKSFDSFSRPLRVAYWRPSSDAADREIVLQAEDAISELGYFAIRKDGVSVIRAFSKLK